MHQVEMQNFIEDDEKKGLLANEDYNNLTWPKTKPSSPPKASTGHLERKSSERKFNNSFNMNISPLASLFQPYKREDSHSRSYDDLNGIGSNGRKRSRSMDLSALHEQFDDDDIQDHIDQFLSTLDRFEDEFDQQAYEELIPLNIRMALENQIFGWNHLYSAFLGHVLMPLASYTMTYWIVTIFLLKGTYCDRRFGVTCAMHKVYQFNENSDKYEPMFGLSMQTFRYVRIALSLWSAFSTFRTIRRRRKVWLHHQATEYFRNNTTAHLDMEQVDRETLLGKLRTRVKTRKEKYLNKRIMRKIQKAKNRFEKRERRRREFYDGSAEYEGDHHRRVQTLSQRGVSLRSKGDETFTTDEDSYASSSFALMSARNKDDTDTFFDQYELYKSIGKDEYERDHGDDDSKTHFYGHTMPAFAMQSIAQDQIRFRNGVIENVPYAHGGFFGAAPFMLANPHWINILRQLMPDVYVEISRRVVHTPVPQLIHWAENNPVVAAYGTAHELEYFGKVPTLEWDVFLDPHLVQRVETVLEARDTFLQSVAIKSRRIRTALGHKRQERRYTDRMENVAALLETEDEKKILHFYNTEIDKRVVLLLEHILIAHGNLSQLSLEQTGYLKRYNFSRVKHTRRTLGGGIYLKHWILTYTEALKLSTEYDGDGVENDDTSMMSEESAMASSRSINTESTRSMSLSSTLKKVDSNEREDAPLLNGNHNDMHPIDEQSSEDHDKDVVLSPLIDTSISSSKPTTPSGSPSREMKPSTSFNDLAMAAVSSSSITESMTTLKKITDCEAPLGLILDVKSRHVPKRVWALVLDALRNMGARVEGIATFFQEDIRDMSKYCITPVNEIIFFHSAGDLQKACHEGLIRKGDQVFFNAGSLFWNYPGGRQDLFKNAFGNVCTFRFDAEDVKRRYKFQPYARVKSDESKHEEKKKTAKYDDIQIIDDDSGDRIRYLEGSSSTIQQYKEHYDLSIGVYVQEFAIDERSMDLLVKYFNMYQSVYNLGFSWGGVNGVTVRGIQPGRFTSTDGFWNQRYIGERWQENLYPPERMQ